MPANAQTSISSVERGRWKLVTSRSTTRKRKPGVMNRRGLAGARARACRRRARRIRARAAWSCRRRRRGRRARAPRRSPPTVAAGMSKRSACMRWRASSSSLDGLERAGAHVQRHERDAPRRAPRARRACASSKCRPAVGAATAPGCARVDGLVARVVVGVRRHARYTAAAAPRRGARASPSSGPSTSKRSRKSGRRARARARASPSAKVIDVPGRGRWLARNCAHA